MLKISKSKTIKALRCCKEIVTRKKCHACPLQEYVHCEAIAKENALCIILEQDRQIDGLQMRIDALNDTNRILMDRNSHQVAAVKLFAKMVKESAAHGWNKSIDAIEHELITSFGGEKDGE